MPASKAAAPIKTPKAIGKLSKSSGRFRDEIRDGEALYVPTGENEFLVYHAQHVAGMDSLGAVRLSEARSNLPEWEALQWIAMHRGVCYGAGRTKEIAVAILLEASKRNLLPL